jgi:hypothetical protein
MKVITAPAFYNTGSTYATRVSQAVVVATIEATTDTAAGDNSAMGYTSAEGVILTGQGTTSDVTIKNDDDGTVIAIPTGTTEVGIGTTVANGKMTIGLTINQGGEDDEILAFKSSDVGHGMTSPTETDTYATFRKAVAVGGLLIEGYQNDAGVSPLRMFGYGATAQTAKTTSARGGVEIGYALRNSATTQDPSANANVLVIMLGNSGTARFIFDTGGSAHADVEWVAYADSYEQAGIAHLGSGPLDDIELLRGLRAIVNDTWTSDMLYNRRVYEDMKILGRDSLHYETRDGVTALRGMVNFTELTKLHHSTILQMHDHFSEVVQSHEFQFSSVEERIKSLETKLLALEGAK